MLNVNFIYALPPLFAGTIVLILGIIIYRNNPHRTRNKTIAVSCFGGTIWLYCYSLNYLFPYYNNFNLFLSRFAYLGVTVIWVTYLHFTIVFLKLNAKKLLIFTYAFAFFQTFIVLFTDLIIVGNYHYYWGPYPMAGKLHPLCLLYAAYIWLYCLRQLYKGYRNRENIHSQIDVTRIKYVFWAYFIGNSAAIDYIQKYGIEFYPFGFINITIFFAVMTYAIVRHQLMEIEVIIKKTLIFAGLFAGVYAVFAGFTFLGQLVFEQVTGENRWISLIPSIAIIVLILRPLENFLKKITDKFLFQKKYDYKELLKTFTTEVLTVLDKDVLVHTTVDRLASIVKIQSCGILLLNKTKAQYELVASVGVERNWRSIALKMDNTLASFLARTRSYLSTKHQGKDSPLPVRIIEDMNKLKLELAIPLTIHEDMIGILTLGKKKSDEDYTQDDMDILLPLARTLAIAISNAMVLDDLSKMQAEATQREKMAVIGTLSAGINHEICNPLGIARGQCEAFLLNMKDGLYKDKPLEELVEKAQKIMEKVIHETDRATVITKRLSSFAKPSKGVISDDIKIKDEIDEVLALVGYELKLDKIDIVKEIEEGLPRLSGDKKQLQEVFFNLIRNAAQAIAERGRITVRAKKDFNRILIEIEDTGHGIPEDKLEEVFNPFYTTKEPGKGTGLGLFIVRQVVERNKGRISVESKVGHGTKFTLEFPVVTKEKVHEQT